MKKFITSIIMALVLITLGGASLVSAAAPTDAEVVVAYQKANVIFDWYTKNPLPTDGRAKYEQGYMIYYNVNHPTIHTMADLRRETETAFTPGLTGKLIASTRLYKEVKGILYVAPANRGDNIMAGTTTFKVLRTSNPDSITLQAITPIYSDHTHKIFVKNEVRDFTYVNTISGWRFADFQNVK